MVSVQDLRKLKKTMQISIPTSAEDFLLLLKRYANLLFALFTARSPLFKCVREIIDALKAYSREARKRMSMKTKGSILWILLLQSRQFRMGEANVLFEFQMMHDDLRAKRAQISHSEVPSELLANSLETVVPPNQAEEGGEPKAKKPRRPNPHTWHPKLRAALAKPLADAGKPSFTQILSFCKGSSYDIIPKGSKICVPNAFFGTCFAGDACKKQHSILRDDLVPISQSNNVVSIS